ncbi:hypothetical protein [Magnetospirillum sp. 64-120]|uniref:hypothetical protein n=1 Tax=Magnetospirillum sp. 64-120 TaxID=1895778 RepID=UPI0025BA4C19|nr:hypothetical protein [Magnetospirillum sp. 64-120]
MKVAVLALLLVLGGCAVLDTPADSASPPTAPDAVKPPPPPRPATPVPARVDPARLQGISGEQAVAMLGRPQADEPQQLGRLWRWRKGACVLTLALYPEVQGGGLRVVASDFTGTSDPGACLGAMTRPGAGDGR